MLRLCMIAILVVIINVSVGFAESGLVEIDGGFYWHGNKNFIHKPLSSGSSGRYEIIDLSSIVIKENSSYQIEIAMLCYGISPNGEVESKETILLNKKKSINGYFELNEGKISNTPIHFNAYYNFVKKIEEKTAGVINPTDLFDGYVCKKERYIWYIPKVREDLRKEAERKEFEFENNMAVVRMNMSNEMQILTGTKVIIVPVIYYYVFENHLYDNGFDKFIEVKGYSYAKTLNGRWIRVLNGDGFLSDGGVLLSTNYWDELPNNLEGDIIKEVCDFAVENKIK